MAVSYDAFTGAFLSKISEYDFINIPNEDRTAIVDGYMKRAIQAFKKNCKYDLVSTGDDTVREFTVDIAYTDIDEIVDIVSDGMIVQWLKPLAYKQELLENALNTRDFTTYSPAELLHRVSEVYTKAQKDYIRAIREYSYNNGKLSELHL